MAETSDFAESAFTWYRAHGDETPPKALLKERINSFEGFLPPSLLLLAADMCIDVAMQDQRESSAYLDLADDFLEEAVELAEDVQPANSQTYYAPATTAQLKRIELPLWRQIANGGIFTPSYSDMLDAFLDTLRFADDPSARSIQRQYMPILLGARALDGEDASGYAARMALERESHRKKPSGDNRANANWNCGIFLDQTVPAAPTGDQAAAVRTNPSVKLQVRSFSLDQGKGNKAAEAYRYAGVVPIDAPEFYFSNTALIGQLCELEYAPALGWDKKLVPLEKATEFLDVITSNLFRVIVGSSLLQAA